MPTDIDYKMMYDELKDRVRTLNVSISLNTSNFNYYTPEEVESYYNHKLAREVATSLIENNMLTIHKDKLGESTNIVFKLEILKPRS